MDGHAVRDDSREYLLGLYINISPHLLSLAAFVLAGQADCAGMQNMRHDWQTTLCERLCRLRFGLFCLRVKLSFHGLAFV